MPQALHLVELSAAAMLQPAQFEGTVDVAVYSMSDILHTAG